LAKSNSTDKLKFEEALEALEEIARALEQGELSLEDSIAQFEKAMKYARLCHDKLEEAERKIQILQSGENGTVEVKEVKVKNETGEIADEEDLQGSLL